MTKTLIALSLAFLLTCSASSQTPLARYVHDKGFKARTSPGSFPLVGDVYHDKTAGSSRLYKLSECFPGVSLDEAQSLDNATEVVQYDTSDVSLLLNIAKKD